jgi:hypothetical protein
MAPRRQVFDREFEASPRVELDSAFDAARFSGLARGFREVAVRSSKDSDRLDDHWQFFAHTLETSATQSESHSTEQHQSSDAHS